MTPGNVRLLCCYALVACLSSAVARAQETQSDAKQLLQSAHQASTLAAVLPYQFQGTVVINPGTENQKKGTITIYRDHERWRSELLVEDYQEIKVMRDNKLYIYRSTPVPVPQLGKLAESDSSWDKLEEDGDARLGEVSRKKVQNRQANCFDVKGPQRHRLCFDPERSVLMQSLDQQRAMEFTNYVEVNGQLFPSRITVLLELEKTEKPVLEIADIKVLHARLAESVFAVPPHAMEFETCENIVAAKPLQTPTPEFSMQAMRRNAGSPAINAYGIIGKDGSLENVKVLTGDAEVQQTIVETLKKWRYTPAMCGSTPVASEKEIPVFIFRGGSGGDQDSVRRGR